MTTTTQTLAAPVATVAAPAAAREAIPALTGMRAFASAWVLGFHLLAPAKVLFPSLGNGGLVAAGYAGVDVFFVLSGFILAHAYKDTLASPSVATWTRFAWLRMARIWPLHAAVTLGLVAAVVVASAAGFRGFAHSPLFRVGELPAHLLLMQSWGGHEAAWNVPSWSVSAEWFAYLCFPVLCIGFARIRSAWTSALIGVGALAAFVGYLYVRRGGELDITFDGGVLRVAAEFTAGVAFERATRFAPARIVKALSSDLVIGILGGALVGMLADGRAEPYSVFVIAAFVIALARSSGKIAHALSGRWLVAAGERSYALYLVHGPVLLFARGVMPETALRDASLAARLAWVAGIVGVVVVLTMVSYSLIEEPARRVMRRLGPKAAPARS